MTIQDIIDDVRPILQDASSPYRWSNAFIVNALNAGILYLHSVRPETRYVDGALVDRVDLPDDYSTAIDIHDRFREALAYYVVYRAYLVDDTDTVNAGLAESYLAKATQRMQL